MEKRDFNKAKDYYQSKSSDEKFVSKAENAYQELYFQYIDSVEIEKACALFNSEIVEAEEFTKKVQEAAIKNMETQREKFIEKSIKYNAVQGIVQNYCVFKDEVISKKANEILIEVSQVNESRVAYKEGMEKADSGDIQGALLNSMRHLLH